MLFGNSDVIVGHIITKLGMAIKVNGIFCPANLDNVCYTQRKLWKLQLLFSTHTLIHLSIATGVTVGIELPRNHTIREDTDPTVEYCVVISVPDMNATIQRSNFSVCVSTVDGTAMGENIDYIPIYCI